MSPLAKIARAILVLHGLMNLAMGVYSISSPQEYAATTGDMFKGSPDRALQSVGLGALGVGWYEFVFALQGSRMLYLSTVPMRLAFAVVTGTLWGWSEAVVKYEIGVAVVAAIAAFA